MDARTLVSITILDRWCDFTEPLEGREPTPKQLTRIMYWRNTLSKMYPDESRSAVVDRVRVACLRARDGDHCHYCGNLLDFTPSDHPPNKPLPSRQANQPVWRATLEHVIPRSAGGTSRLSNLVLACQPCNADQVVT